MHKTLAGALTAALVLSGVRIGFAVEHPSPGGSAQAAPELRPQSAALDVGTATAVATATTPPTALPAPTAAAPNEVPTVASTPGTISVAGGGGIIRLGPLIGSGAEPTFAVQILGIYDIFLAGRPYPFRVQGQSGADTAGRNSPQMLRLSVPAGHTISITTRGATAQTPSARLARDANGFIESTFLGGSAEPAATRTGLSSIVAPADSLVGVFLSNRPPGGKVPATLDFTGSAARNAIVVRPALGQVFFVGRGITNKGARKRFITPAGATRLFLGSFDHLGSNHDNKGAIVVNITGIAPASNPYQPLPTSTATPVPPTITQTPAATASPFPSDTVTSTPLPTSTPIPTDTPIPTVTITSTPTFTATPSLTATPTLTPTPTVTQTSTPVPTTTPFKFPGT